MADPIVTSRRRGLTLYRQHRESIIWRVDGLVLVPSSSSPNRVYEVDLGKQTCTCEWWKYNRKTCAHMIAAELRVAELRRRDEKRSEEARARSLEKKKDRIQFTPEQFARQIAILEGMA